MFLVTTADERFWKTDEKTLFLGEWCKLYERRHVWSALLSEVQAYHWDNRARYFRDFTYLQGLYERHLKSLADNLNEIHGVAYAVRYWRILIGYWLQYFIQILYDRYVSIETAAASGLVTNTWVGSYDEGEWTPGDFVTFNSWFISDSYNGYLYDTLIKEQGIPFEVANHRRQAVPIIQLEDRSPLKQLAKRCLSAYTRRIPERWNRTVFVESYLTRWELLKLQLALRQIPCISTRFVTSVCSPFDKVLRDRLLLETSKIGNSRFEQVLGRLIPDQIPTAYVESYAEMRRRATKIFPKRPSVILTANSYSSYEEFKFWSAHQVHSGAKLVVWQHGGHDGTGQCSADEEHIIQISDQFLTWGWRMEAEDRVVPFYSGKLAKFQESVSPSPDGFILWVGMSLPRYSYRMYSVPVGPQVGEYVKDQLRFIEHLTSDVRRLLMLRLFPTEYGWNEVLRFKDRWPAVKTYRGKTPIIDQLRKGRLMICTYNSTTYLETFAANYPTLMFWNPQHWELRPSAQPFFDELHRVGILHYSPESAAAKLNEIYGDPSQWWHSIDIQSARKTFCERFARTNPDWLLQCKKQLTQLYSGDLRG